MTKRISTPKIYSPYDRIDHGINKGEQYAWIYRLNFSYFLWLLVNNDKICFENLKVFKSFGPPICLKKESFDQILMSKIMNKYPKRSSSGSLQLSIPIIEDLMELGHVNLRFFEKQENEILNAVYIKNLKKLSIAEKSISKNESLEIKKHFSSFY